MGILSTFAQRYYADDPSYYSSYSGGDTVPTFIFAILFFFLFVGIYIVTSLCLMRIFKKAGVESWIAWVPFYNNWKLLEIGGQQGFWAVLAIIPFVSIVSAVFMIIAFYNIGLKFGKDGIYVVLAIFIPIVWFIILALDKSVWNDAVGAPSLAPETANAPKQPL
jgi:hypothetical protein